MNRKLIEILTPVTDILTVMYAAIWLWYERALAKKNITLVPVGEDLVDVIWTDPIRSSIPNNRLIVHPIEFTGRRRTAVHTTVNSQHAILRRFRCSEKTERMLFRF